MLEPAAPGATLPRFSIQGKGRTLAGALRDLKARRIPVGLAAGTSTESACSLLLARPDDEFMATFRLAPTAYDDMGRTVVAWLAALGSGLLAHVPAHAATPLYGPPGEPCPLDLVRMRRSRSS